MLHIILLILKIIGIVLLCILGILLLAVCCALFVPLRYRIEVFREEGEGKPPFTARAKITWLLHLVNIHVCYPSDVYVKARIFLFTLLRFPENEEKKKSPRRKREKTKEKQDAQTTVQEGEGTQDDCMVEEENGDLPVAAPEKESGSQPVQDGFAVQDEEPEPQDSAQKPSGFIRKLIKKIHDLVDKIKQIIIKIKKAAENIQYTIRRICDKIKSVSDNIQYYREVLESDSFRNSWNLCREHAGIILKGLKPDKFEADMVVGTEDPAVTGEILAVCGMLYPLAGQHVRVVGDFERAHIEGRVYIKGKIRVFTFLRVAVKVYLNKDIKKLIKLFKKEAV